MRTILLAALLAATILPATGSASELRAHRVSATARSVALADATTLAYKASIDDTGLVLRGDDRTTRMVSAPAGCRLTGAGSGLLSGVCGQVSGVDLNSKVDLLVAGLDGGPLARLTAAVNDDYANAAIVFEPTEAGREWLAIPNGAKDSPNWTTTVNWHTGEVRDVYGTDPRQVVDLDAPTLTVPLCAPLKHYDGSWLIPDGLAPNVVVRGRWALLQKPDERFELHRCGSAKPVALPKGFRPTALGDGWVGGMATAAHRASRPAVVRLTDRRHFVITGAERPPVAYGSFTFTAGRAYVQGDHGLYTVKLPGRRP